MYPVVYGVKRPNARPGPASGMPGCATPSTNWVGVVTTPARTPERKSRSTRSATSGERRSCSKRSRSRPERPGALPQVRLVQMGLILEQRVVHLPEAPLKRGRLGRARQHPRARMLRGHREVPEHALHGQCLQDQVRTGAVRALEVRVLEHHRPGAPDVVVGTRVRRRAAGPARQRSGSRRGSRAARATCATT